MKQRGYSLLLSLFALAGLGGAGLISAASYQQISTHYQTLELSRARDALISYAVNYIDHYGAQSAGIGHLPCPDTDNPDSTQADAWRLDGPNPPCAANAVERGWLPRKVDVVGGRYHFHTRAKQGLLYEVSGRYVNNPLSRVVNPATTGDITVGGHTGVVAVLKTSMETDAAYTLIRTADIRQQAMQRVGAWLVDKLATAWRMRCSQPAATTCVAGYFLLADCELRATEELLHWLHIKPVSGDCESYKTLLKSTYALWDDVPFNRHWFVRNAWGDFIELQLDHNCIAHDLRYCRFALLPIGRDDQQIIIRIVPNVEAVTR